MSAGPYEIELVGGHADGRTYAIAELFSQFHTLGPVGIDVTALAAEAEPAEPVLPEIVSYVLELNQATGRPRRTAQGRYIYRHGPRPAPAGGVPHVLADAFPRAHGWQRRGEGRWRATERVKFGRDCLLYVLILTERGRTAYACHRVSFEALAHAYFDLEQRVYAKLEHQCHDELLPGCVVPGCTGRGRMLFHAAAPGRLAGRQWRPGEEIRLCHPHAHDVYTAAGCFRVDQLAEWLRPDAIPEPDWQGDPAAVQPYWSSGCTLPLREILEPWRATGPSDHPRGPVS